MSARGGANIAPSRRIGFSSEPGLASVSIIPASESGFCALVTATTAAATHTQAASANDAPTAGQKKRMSMHMPRSCDHVDCSRSV